MRRRLFPAWMRTYDRSWLRADTLAGVTVLAYAVPQVLAYSSLVGLPPLTGLVAAAVTMLVYPFIGTSRVLSVGPESTTALMAGLVLAPLIARNPERAVGLTAALTLFVALWFALGRLLHAGVLAQLLTHPILTGFLAGEASLMIASQLGKATRTSSSGATVPEQLADFLHTVSKVHWPSVLVAAGTLALLMVLPRIHARIPAALSAVVIATLTSFLLGGPAHGVLELGALPRGLPPVTLPALAAADFQPLVIGALGIALLAFSDMMLVARSMAEPGEEVDAERELTAASTMNAVASLFGGYPSSASSSRAAIGRGAGQRTQFASLVAAVGVAAVLAFAGPLFTHLPLASLAALVFWAGARLVSIGDYRALWRFRRSEFAIAITTALGTALLGILPGIGIAVALSGVQILVALARPHEAIQGYAVGMAGLHDVDDYAKHVTIPGLLIYRYDGPLLAYNREDFKAKLMQAVLEYEPRWVLLNVEANMLVDFSACEMLRVEIGRLQSQGRTVALARLKHDLRTQLEAAGIMAMLVDHAYETLPQAIRAYHEANPEVVLPPIPAPGAPFDPGGPSSI